jgi:hypothetical protein
MGLTVASNAVEKDGFLDGRDQGMTYAAQHRVIRPDGELILAGFTQSACIIQQVLLTVLELDAQAVRHLGGEFPATLLDVFYADQGERIGMPTLSIDEIDGMENLHRLVCIQGRDHPGDPVQVAIDKSAEPAVVVDRTGAGAPADIEFEIWNTKGVLGIDDEQADPDRVFGGRSDPMACGPGTGLPGPRLVWDAPHRAHLSGLKMGWNGKLSTRH